MHAMNWLRRLFGKRGFVSGDYWQGRYTSGGNSGAGSYDQLATYKAEFINDRTERFNLRAITELGCGDGNQLGMFTVGKYTGLDVAKAAVERCKMLYRGVQGRRFALYRPGKTDPTRYKADAALSLDVLYHLIEDAVYEQHLSDLFAIGQRYVIIYAWNTNADDLTLPTHVLPRKFTDYISEHFPDWELAEHEKNPFPAWKYGQEKGSNAEFFVYRHKNESARIHQK